MYWAILWATVHVCRTICSCMYIFVHVLVFVLSLLVSPHFMRGWELSTWVVILFVIMGSHFQVIMWTSYALQLLVFLHWWKKLFSIVLLYLESHARYRKSRKLEKSFLDLSVSNFHFRRLIKGLNHSFSVSY